MSTMTLDPKVLEADVTAQINDTEKQTKSSSEDQQNSPTIDRWLAMSRDELDEVYKKAQAGVMPQGDTRGTVILAGGILPKIFSNLARFFAWQGKVIDLYAPKFDTGVLVNKITPLGLNLIVAKIYRDTSWMDGKETIVIDYSKTSLFARQIRDEIREIEPGLYLGKVWWGKKRILDFCLETHERTAL